MKENTQNEITNKLKTESFKNTALDSKFVDGNYLYKIAGENKWYIINSDGNVIVRSKPNGEVEFAEVDFYDMVGEPIGIEIGAFTDGFMAVRIVCNENDTLHNNFYEISPSGYTYNATKTKGELFSKFSLNYRSQKEPETLVNKRPVSIKHINYGHFHSIKHLDLIYDIAQHSLMQSYDRFIESKKNSQSKVRTQVYVSAANTISKRYNFLKESLEKRQLKHAKKLAQKTAEKQPE